MTSWTDAFSTTPALAEVMGDAALVSCMLRFEAALAQAQAQAGLAPASAAETITAACASLHYDPDALFRDGARAGTLAIPLVKALTAAVRAADPAAAAWVHFGATSQDAIDTALILQLDRAFEIIDADLARLCDGAAELARNRRAAPMLGRTLLQPATPIVFGLKAAQWLVAGVDCRARLARLRDEALALQFGGAAGTLGSLGEHAEATARNLAKLLTPNRTGANAGVPLPWHTRRGALVAFAAELGVLCGICAKIARDVSLLMQFEVSEALEPAEAGRGGSSAMPHKRNPVLCMLTLSAGLRAPQHVALLLTAMAQEHERGLGGWQAEWAALPDLVKLAGGALANMAETVGGLIVDEARLRANLDSLRGLPMTEAASLAIARRLGRDEAHKIVEAAAKKASADGVWLAEALAADARVSGLFSRADIDAFLDPMNSQGATQAFIDAALARHLAQKG